MSGLFVPACGLHDPNLPHCSSLFWISHKTSHGNPLGSGCGYQARIKFTYEPLKLATSSEKPRKSGPLSKTIHSYRLPWQPMLRPTLKRLAKHIDASTARAASPPQHKTPPLSLDFFLQRQRVLSLWREILRALAKISDDSMAMEMRAFAREEFIRHRQVTDIAKIRYLISTGREQFRSMSRYVEQIKS